MRVLVSSNFIFPLGSPVRALHLNEALSGWEVVSLLIKNNSLTLLGHWQERRGAAVASVIWESVCVVFFKGR